MAAWEAARGSSDEWYTPPEVFEALGIEFDLDVASPEDRTHTCVPAREFISSNSLGRQWSGRVWMNPPFGGRADKWLWLREFFRHGNGIALTPDRTSAPWFWRAWPKAQAVLFTRKIRFVMPDGSRGKQPSTGTALWAAGEDNVAALRRAASCDFGIMATPQEAR